jgi:membrane protease subunit (stomatin/prohibitin family)
MANEEEENGESKDKKKKRPANEVHQSVNVVVDDSVISRSNIGNIGGGGGGDVQVQRQVENKRTAGVKKKFCSNCGSPLPTSYKANFCPECGAEVK